MNFRVIIIAIAILALAGCGRGKQAPGRIPQASDSLYTSQAAMKIYANSLEGLQRDKAIALCEELLESDSTQVVDKSTAANRNDVLDVMMDACRKNGDNEKWLRYAVERADLSLSRTSVA